MTKSKKKVVTEIIEDMIDTTGTVEVLESLKTPERLPVKDSKKDTILRNQEITKHRNKTLKLRKKSFCGEVG